jgi:hypothetical protein
MHETALRLFPESPYATHHSRGACQALLPCLSGGNRRHDARIMARMVDTIARRMGIPFEEASTIADDCA